jgi:hypothetical protein
MNNKIKMVGEKQRYTIQARSNRYVILTKPFNARKTYLYSIVDLEQKIRGRDNLIFGFCFIDKNGEISQNYNCKEGAEEAIKMLEKGEMEVSHRHHKKLEKEEIYQLTDGK